MYIVNINIHTGGAAFGDTESEASDEIARILRELADQLQVRGGLEDFNQKRLHDINGNKVGTVLVDES